MSRLSAIQNINKKYSVTAIRPFGSADSPNQAFTPNSVVNRGTPISQTVIRRSQVSNIPGGPLVEVVQETTVGPRAPIETIERTEVYHEEGGNRRISVNQSRGVRPKEYWESPVVTRSGGNSTPIISRVRRGYVSDDGGRNRCRRCCNWACLLWTLLILLLLAAIGFVLSKAFGNMFGAKRAATKVQLQKPQEGLDQQIDNQIANINPNEIVGNRTGLTQLNKSQNFQQGVLNCDPGFFLQNGKCLSCPENSTWNGTHCVRRQLVSADLDSQNKSAATVTAPQNTTTASSSGSTSEMDNTTDELPPPEATVQPVKTTNGSIISAESPIRPPEQPVQAASNNSIPNLEATTPLTPQPNPSELPAQPQPPPPPVQPVTQPPAQPSPTQPQPPLFAPSPINQPPPPSPDALLASANANNQTSLTPNTQATLTPTLTPTPTPTPPAEPLPTATATPTPLANNTTSITPEPTAGVPATAQETLINPNNVTVIAHLRRSHKH